MAFFSFRKEQAATGDKYYDGFAKFIQTNFPNSIAGLAEIFSDVNRFQGGDETMEELLARNPNGPLAQKIISLYHQEFQSKHPEPGPNLTGRGSASYLQSFSEVVTGLLRKRS